MVDKIDLIELVGVDSFGANFEVAGTWKGKPYHIEVNVGYDSRDVESEAIGDGYNPMDDWDPTGTDFHTVLWADEKFTSLYREGIKAWELLPIS